ncbi:phage tail spike protein [Oceanobacillus kimchii]|uniref:phage tail spike protein n=1 Tax=Oceanobacillus kimchii TaxID=746691 RepID=UPI0003480DE4|nr:phage tail spike protein [Oceanobacillus kimchii]
MSELYIFSQYEQPLTILSEDTGLVSTHFREEKNSVPTTPFSFTIEADHALAKHVKDENKVVVKDREGDWRMMVIRELDDSDTIDGPITTATCEPAFLAELNDHIVVDRRFVERTADIALDAALDGTRWQGSVEVELGNATTNFYYITSVDAIWDILSIWGGEFKDVIEFNEETNEITAFKIKIIQRLGKEHGQRFEIDHNINEIGRTVLSYPKTALYGRGASLPYEDDEGEHTGGYTRYIGFEDVEWKVSNGDPVDKPKGQRWVGSPDALAKYGLEDGTKHRFGIYSNQDHEDPEELLKATWHHLQEIASQVEVNYRLSVELFEDEVSLGDTATAIDRKFSRPIEIQTRIIALEYNLLDPDSTMVVEMGQFLDFNDNRLDDLEKEVEGIKRNPPKQQIDENSYPNRKPSTPINLETHAGMEVIQLYWTYADELFIKHYEVYGSRIDGFIPDTQHLLWRGQVSAFSHTVGTNEVWYYRVRAVNYHGTPSDWSVQVSAGTHRVVSEDILWGPDLAERMRELHHVSDIIGAGGVNFDQISQEAKNLLDQQARQYTDGEIGAVKEQLDIKFNEYGDRFARITQDIDEINGSLSSKVEKGTFEEFTNSYEYDMSEISQRYDEISSTVRNIQIGGRNIAAVNRVGTNQGSLSDYVYRLTKSSGSSNPYLRISREYFELDSDYVATFKVRKISGTVFSMAGHSSSFNGGTTYRDGTRVSSRPWNVGDQNYPNDTEIHQYEVHFRTPESFPTDSAPYWYIQPNRSDYGEDYVLEIWDFQIEKGNKATDWQPAYEDTDQRMTYAESRITQLAEEIDLKVDVDGIVSQINLNREGVRIKGNLIHLDGTTLINNGVIQNAHIANGTIERAKLVRAIIGEAQIEDLAVTDAKIASLNADKINASSLSAISANLGTVRAGRLLSSNNNLDANLNTGNITLRNANLTIANGAQINFEDAGNTLTYRKYDSNDGFSRSAGVGVGDRIGGRYPFAYLGTTGASNLDSLSPYFSGFIANSTAATGADNATNSVNGFIFQMRNRAVGWDKGITFDFNGNPNITMIGGQSNDYSIGALYQIRGKQAFNVINDYNSRSGWYLETTYAGNGTDITFRGMYGADYNYQIGGNSNTHAIRNIYLRNTPQYPSDRRLKEDIRSNELGLDFINDVETNTYRLIQKRSEKKRNEIQFGIIAQQLKSTFEKHGVETEDYSIIGIDDDGMYGVQESQLLFPTIKSVQELSAKLDDEINWQRVEYTDLKNKVVKLEKRIEELEAKIA